VSDEILGSAGYKLLGRKVRQSCNLPCLTWTSDESRETIEAGRDTATATETETENEIETTTDEEEMNDTTETIHTDDVPETAIHLPPATESNAKTPPTTEDAPHHLVNAP
jgi:hypothetical protein